MDIKLNSNYHMKYILLKNRSERDQIKNIYKIEEFILFRTMSLCIYLK